MEYLALSSDAPGTDPLVLIDGPPYDPWVVVGDIEVGPAQWETTFGSPHGTRGAAVAGDRVGNRTIVMTLRGAFSSKAEASGYENQLAAVLDEMRRFGGWVSYRVHGGTRRAWWRVLARDYSMEPWGQRFDRVNELRPRLVFTVEPYPYGDPMDFEDEFDTASVWDSDYTASAAGAGALTAATSGTGELVPVSVPFDLWAVHTGSGYDLGDTEARASFVLGSNSINGFSVGVILKYIDEDNLLLANVARSGGSWVLAVTSIVAGTPAVVASSALSAPATGVPLWVQGRVTGGQVTAEFGAGTHPFTPTTTATANLSGAALTTLGPTGRGKAGVQWAPQHANDRVRRFMVEPFTYEDVSRYPIEVCGDIPGTAPAELEVDMSAPAAGTPWLALAWAAKPSPWNRIHNEGFEVTGGNAGGDTVGWVVTAVTGVTGAASSISRVTSTAYEGVAAGQVVTPATANTGASYRMQARFERGRTYRFRIMVRAAAGTTNVRARLGVNGDITSSTAVALSTTWTEHVVDWTPAATVNQAYAAVEVTAATATTFQVDRAQVYLKDDGPPARRGTGHAGRAPWGLIDGLAGWMPAGAIPDSVPLSGEPYAQLDVSVSSLGESYLISWALDPTTIPRDDHAGPTRDVEVWARLVMSNQFDGGVTALLSVAESVYTYEWGSDGCRLVMPNSALAFRIYRLGTIPIPDLVGDTGNTKLDLRFDVAAGTNNVAIGVDWLWLMNPRARVLTPTGIDPDPGYPALAPDGRVNREGMVTGIRDGSHRHLGTLSGAVELPAGPVEFALLNSTAIPDAPTPGGVAPYTLTGDEVTDTPKLHLRVRPRFEFLIAEE